VAICIVSISFNKGGEMANYYDQAKSGTDEEVGKILKSRLGAEDYQKLIGINNPKQATPVHSQVCGAL